VAGVLQVNARVPNGLSGAAVPITIRVGTATSQANITIAVQ
jgi:uncharacterized protein (TIGR03437 family)